MKYISVYVVLLTTLFVGCIKQYKHTVKVCDGKLYVERFNVNPAGVDADYLTDSLSFRIYVGNWDNEHENFTYGCNADSVFIEKIDASEVKFRVLEKRAYSIQDLKKKKIL